MNLRIACLLLGLVGVSGCVAPLKYYVVPQDALNAARIRVILESDSRTTFALSTYAGSERCSDRYLMYAYNSAVIPPNNEMLKLMEWTTIEANKTFTFSTAQNTFRSPYSYLRCEYTFSMLPQSGHDYIIFPKVDIDDKKCFLIVRDITANQTIPLVKRIEHRPLKDDGDWCKP